MRKNEQEAYSRKVTIRFKVSEYARLEAMQQRTTCRKLSAYARKVLLQKPVVFNLRNQSADDMLTAFTGIQKSLSGVANNFNQVVKKMYNLQQNEEYKAWYMLLRLEQQTVQSEIEKIRSLMVKIYEDGSKNCNPLEHNPGAEL
jgi:hypothetical protein